MNHECSSKLASGVCVTHVAAEAAPQKATISVCSSCAGSQVGKTPHSFPARRYDAGELTRRHTQSQNPN